MRVEMNGAAVTLAARNLAEALIEAGHGGPAIATAVNGTFVPAAARAATLLQDGDRIEVLAPMQGG